MKLRNDHVSQINIHTYHTESNKAIRPIGLLKRFLNKCSRCLFYFIYFLFIFYFIVFCWFFLDVFSMSVTDALMNLAPWTGFYNAVLQPPYASNSKS